MHITLSFHYYGIEFLKTYNDTLTFKVFYDEKLMVKLHVSILNLKLIIDSSQFCFIFVLSINFPYPYGFGLKKLKSTKWVCFFSYVCLMKTCRVIVYNNEHIYNRSRNGTKIEGKAEVTLACIALEKVVGQFCCYCFQWTY